MTLIQKLRFAIRDYVDALREEDDDHSLIQQVQDLVLTPLRAAISPTAIKAYLSVLLFLTTSLTLVAVSSTAYFLFYYHFIPQINLEKTIYLQYGPGSHPSAIIPLQATALISQQQYDIEVVLHVPRTPANLAAGNFMVDISLINDKDSMLSSPLSNVLPNTSLDPSSQPLFRSRRPAMLPYSSPLTSVSYSLLHLPSHLLKLRDLDSSTIVVPLFERLSFARGRQNVPTHAYLEVQSQMPLNPPEPCPTQAITLAQGLNMMGPPPSTPVRTLQIYSAKLKFRARFRGLRYVVYNYRVLSFLLFSTLFYGFAITSMAVAWLVISAITDKGQPGRSILPPLKKEANGDANSTVGSSDSKTRVKSEDDSRTLSDLRAAPGGEDISGHSSNEGDPGARTDTSTTFPGLGRTVRPMRYPGSPPYDTSEPTEGIEPSHHEDGTNDAEDEEDYQATNVGQVKEEEDDDEELQRFADSGIGTSMESEQPGPGLVRRRSGRRS